MDPAAGRAVHGMLLLHGSSAHHSEMSAKSFLIRHPTGEILSASPSFPPAHRSRPKYLRSVASAALAFFQPRPATNHAPAATGKPGPSPASPPNHNLSPAAKSPISFETVTCPQMDPVKLAVVISDIEDAQVFDAFKFAHHSCGGRFRRLGPESRLFVVQQPFPKPSMYGIARAEVVRIDRVFSLARGAVIIFRPEIELVSRRVRVLAIDDRQVQGHRFARRFGIEGEFSCDFVIVA